MASKNTKRFLNALNDVDDEYIVEAQYKSSKEGEKKMNKKNWITLTATVAVVGICVASFNGNNTPNAPQMEAMPQTVQNQAIEEDSAPRDAVKPNPNSVQIANPWRDFETLDEVIDSCGYGIEAPMEINGIEFTHYMVLEGDKMIMICYSDGEYPYNIRKARGSDDISGNYSSYENTWFVEEDGMSIELQGDDGLVALAKWQKDDFTYCFNCDAIQMNQEDVLQLIKEVK